MHCTPFRAQARQVSKQASNPSESKAKKKPSPLLLTILRRGRQATGGRVSKQEHGTSKADEHWRPFEHDNALRHPATV